LSLHLAIDASTAYLKRKTFYPFGLGKYNFYARHSLFSPNLHVGTGLIFKAHDFTIGSPKMVSCLFYFCFLLGSVFFLWFLNWLFVFIIENVSPLCGVSSLF